MTAKSGVSRGATLSIRVIWDLLRDTTEEWQKDNAPRLAAALTYYTLFSMPPIFIITLAVASVILGPQAARGELFLLAQGYVGVSGAQIVQNLVENSAKPGTTLIATGISVVAVFLGASGLFAELQYALNQIWDIPTPQPKGIFGGLLTLIKERLLAFALVLGGGVL
ncbi:MAG TPA: YhjD/YihY/BrkB family envelope integrity protein, partial [Anaerolineae bacterium]